jgi:hypothetical protein
MRSRPIVAVSAAQALEEWRAEIELEEGGHLQGIVVVRSVVEGRSVVV